MRGIQPVILQKIGADVLAHGKGVFAPVGKAPEHRRQAKHTVVGRNKAKAEFFLQRAAEKGGNPRVRMNDVKGFRL